MIPVNEPKFGAREKELLNQCIDTGWVSSDGPFIKQFEQLFASFIGVKHGVAVCNGTAAIEASLFALDVREGDEVIMPTFTIISCAWSRTPSKIFWHVHNRGTHAPPFGTREDDACVHREKPREAFRGTLDIAQQNLALSANPKPGLG